MSGEKKRAGDAKMVLHPLSASRVWWVLTPSKIAKVGVSLLVRHAFKWQTLFAPLRHRRV